MRCLATTITESGISGIEVVRQALAGKVSVLVGHSGVGKSTLINALVPAANRVTGHVNEVTGRGRHTSTNLQAVVNPDGGWVIDTPRGCVPLGWRMWPPTTFCAALLI